MKEYIILLRGVMPTGKNKVPMALLREALTKFGFQDVRTYIQSGNVMAKSKLSQKQVEKAVHDVIEKSFGGDIAVVAIEVGEFQKIVQENPFQKKKPENVYYNFLKEKPDTKKLAELAKLEISPEKISISEKVIYQYCPGLYSQSKMKNALIERKLGVSATNRVSRTVLKLLELTKA